MTHHSADLKYPKIPILVDLALESLQPCSVEIFVAKHQDHAFPHQLVIDLLESDLQFLPARVVEEGGVLIFNKANVVWVRMELGRDHDPPLAEQSATLTGELFDIHRRVSVELLSSPALEGNILYSAPSQLRRMQDYLNQQTRFFCLWTEEHLYLINKAYLLNVHEIAEEKIHSGSEYRGTNR